MLKYLILFLSPLIFSCQNAREYQETEQELAIQNKAKDFIIFGKEYGHCQGDCIHLFKIQDGKIYADDLSRAQFGKGAFSFNSNPLDQEYFKLAEELTEAVNKEMLAIAPGTYGIPDAHDQGGVYFGIGQNETIKLWFADPVVGRIPKPMQQLVQKINKITHEIRQKQNDQ